MTFETIKKNANKAIVNMFNEYVENGKLSHKYDQRYITRYVEDLVGIAMLLDELAIHVEDSKLELALDNTQALIYGLRDAVKSGLLYDLEDQYTEDEELDD